MGKPMLRAEDYDRSALESRLRTVGWTVTVPGCWEWKGSRNADGYGLFTAKRLGFTAYGAHRVMYECFVEPIPDGLIIRHRCDNPPCVNPDHLVPGTLQDNVQDMVERRRHRDHGRTECVHQHDLTLSGALLQRTKKRDGRTIAYSICAQCEYDRKARHAQRKREAA